MPMKKYQRKTFIIVKMYNEWWQEKNQIIATIILYKQNVKTNDVQISLKLYNTKNALHFYKTAKKKYYIL